MMAETSVLVVLQFINVVALVVVDVDDIISFVLLLFFVSVATIRGHSPLHWEIIGTQPWIQTQELTMTIYSNKISPLDGRDTGLEDNLCHYKPPASPAPDTQTVSEYTNLEH